MNRFLRIVKENTIPAVVFLAVLLSCTGAWYFLHPSSPYHERYSFVVAFDAVGTLSPGDKVKVRGISRGQITKVELTENAVYATVEVLAATKISKNSEFRLINSGLMGERELSILNGDSRDLLTPGDTLIGKYDEGTSGISKKLSNIMGSLSDIRDTVRVVMDSISNSSARKRLNRVTRKAKKLTDLTKSDVLSWKSDVENLLGECDKSLQNANNALENVAERGSAKVDDINALLDRAQLLLKKVNELKGQSGSIMQKLDNGDNSASLLLSKESPFNKQMETLLANVDSLLSDIKRSGVMINVDIF